jgi:TRAP-type C4-dicarboxylate transport system substrate-binding protein
MGKNKRVKVVNLVTVLILLLSALIVCGKPVVGSAAQAKPIELSIALSIIEMNDRWTKVVKPWIETIQKESKGQIKINPYFVGTLTKEQQNYQGLVDGLIDLSYATFVSEWGRFPITEIMLVSPPGGKMYTRPSRVMWDLYTQFPEFRKEYAQVKLLSFNALPLSTLAFTKPVTKLEDMKGKKISTGCQAQLKALGAQPVFQPFEQCYDSLSKGVFDGIDCAEADYVANKFAEVAKYKLTNSPIKAYPAGLAMSIGSWNRLSPELQAIFVKYSGAYFADLADTALAAAEADSKRQAMKMGAQYITLSPAEAERWAKAIAPTRTGAAEAMNAKGLPGTQLLKTMDDLIAKYSK